MTAVEWLIEELKKVHHPTEAMIMYAKKLEKQQMFDYIKKNYVNGEHSLKFHKEEFEQYYNETYGSKGSDENKQ